MTSYASEYGFQQIENPVALATETKIRRNGIRNTYNVTATYEPVKNLFLKANLGMYTYSESMSFIVLRVFLMEQILLILIRLRQQPMQLRILL